MEVTPENIEAAGASLAKEHPLALVQAFILASESFGPDAESDPIKRDQYGIIRWAWQQFVQKSLGLEEFDKPASHEEWQKWQQTVFDYADKVGP